MRLNLFKSRNTKLAIAFFILIVVTICFETAQQLYYINRFELAKDASFLNLFKFQAVRWIVWVVLAFVLLKFIKNKSNLTISPESIYQITMLILGLVFIGIIIIAFIQMMFDGGKWSFDDLIHSYIPFYTFQKGPIFTLGYIALTIIFYYYFRTRQLQIEVLKLEELKLVSLQEYEKLKNTSSTDASFLNIKLGNKQKIISIDDIRWFEADDYCVKIHTIKNSSYTMRISLKELESKLHQNFLRVHRKAIVNMQMVKEFQNDNRFQLILNNEVKVPVSKSKLKEVKKYYS